MINDEILASLEYEEFWGTIYPGMGGWLQTSMATWPGGSAFSIMVPPEALPGDPSESVAFSMRIPTQQSYWDYYDENGIWLPLIILLEPAGVNFAVPVTVMATWMPWVSIPAERIRRLDGEPGIRGLRSGPVPGGQEDVAGHVRGAPLLRLGRHGTRRSSRNRRTAFPRGVVSARIRKGSARLGRAFSARCVPAKTNSLTRRGSVVLPMGRRRSERARRRRESRGARISIQSGRYDHAVSKSETHVDSTGGTPDRRNRRRRPDHTRYDTDPMPEALALPTDASSDPWLPRVQLSELRGGFVPQETTVHGLTILIEFSDEPSVVTPAEVDAFMNDDNFTGFAAGRVSNGSVHGYFADVSGGLVDYTNAVVAEIYQPEETHAYWAAQTDGRHGHPGDGGAALAGPDDRLRLHRP